MKTFLANSLVLVSSIFFLFLLMVFPVSDQLSIKDITVYQKDSVRPITIDEFPYSTDHIGTYRIKFLLKSAQTDFNLIPDDELLSITVNGQPVSLENYSRSDLRDYDKGFNIALPHLDENAWNTIDVILSNKSNPAGFNFRSTTYLTPGQALGIYVILALFFFTISRKIPLSSAQKIIALISIGASVIYLAETPSNVRTFDVYEGGGHKDYIEYLINEKSLPPPGEGWEYHQPPLYYMFAAVTKTFLATENQPEDLWGQLLALWLWVIFLTASLGAVNLALKRNPVALVLASLTICLWPSGIIHSIRIGNDVPLYALYALAFYYTVRWWSTRCSKELFWALLWSSLALLTKSNALTLWGILGILLLAIYLPAIKACRGKEDFQRLEFKPIIMASAFFVASIALNLGDNVWDYATGESDDWLLSNVSTTINPGLKVENSVANYVIFDFDTYLKSPFISTWDDRYGRQYFWNFVARSSLTSEYFFDGDVMELWGKANGVLLLVFVLTAILYLVCKSVREGAGEMKPAIIRDAPWILGLILPFILLLAYRIKVPLSCNTDFRYVYPVLVPLVYFGLVVWSERRHTIFKILSLSGPIIATLTIPWVFVLSG